MIQGRRCGRGIIKAGDLQPVRGERNPNPGGEIPSKGKNSFQGLASEKAKGKNAPNVLEEQKNSGKRGKGERISVTWWKIATG